MSGIWRNGTLFPESKMIPVNSFDPNLMSCPDPFFAFEFIKNETQHFVWPDGEMDWKWRETYQSSAYYPGGSFLTGEQLLERFPDNENLAFNIKHLGDTMFVIDRYEGVHRIRGGATSLDDVPRNVCCGEEMVVPRKDMDLTLSDGRTQLQCKNCHHHWSFEV